MALRIRERITVDSYDMGAALAMLQQYRDDICRRRRIHAEGGYDTWEHDRHVALVTGVLNRLRTAPSECVPMNTERGDCRDAQSQD